MITQLPTEDSTPTRDVTKKIVLIYGQRKIGKTTFCAGAESALFLATEPGQSHLTLRKIEVPTWTDFLAACKLIAQGEHDRKTIVIDTIDNLYKFCREHVLAKNNLVHESDQAYGRGYDLVNGTFSRALIALALLPYGLMMISHAQEKEVKTRTGKETKIALTLPGSAAKIVAGLADYILYADVEEVKDGDGLITGFHHVIKTRPTTMYEAGMRTEIGQQMPEVVPLNYGAFSRALNGGAITEEDWLPPTLTTETPKTKTGGKH